MALNLTLPTSSTTNPSLLPKFNTSPTCLQLRLPNNKPFRCMCMFLSRNSCNNNNNNNNKKKYLCSHSKPHIPQQHDRPPCRQFSLDKSSLAAQLGVLLATVAQPAFAVTGVNNEEDFTWILIQLAIVAFWYFLIMPPIIMNWLRIRWYKRNLLEMYLQFMFVFMFFPSLLLWAPFLDFRKFPRDPSMKYPWSTPEDPLQVKNSYLKYPFAKPEDYE